MLHDSPSGNRPRPPQVKESFDGNLIAPLFNGSPVVNRRGVVLVRAMKVARVLTSMPAARRPRLIASSNVVPAPAKTGQAQLHLRGK